MSTHHLSAPLFSGLRLILALALSAAIAWPSDTPCSGYTPIDSLPYSINSPGLYRVTGNLSAGAGITITSSDVTLDLNGFLLEGEPGAAPGIFVGDVYSNIVVRNGTLRNWSLGVHALFGSSLTFERLRVFDCSTYGVLAGPRSEVSKCLVIDCGEGISVSTSARVIDCIVRGGETGIDLGLGATATRCLVSDTTTAGVTSSADAIITHVVSRANAGDGMFLGPRAHVSRAIVADNEQAGVVGAANGLIERVVSTDNGGIGINVFSDAGDGRTSIQSTVSARNGSHGIRTTTATLIANCVTAENFGHGVTAEDFCTVHHLLSANNTNFGAGLYLAATDSFARDNHLVGNQYGLWAAGTYNELIQNSARDNVIDYSIASPNVFGPTSSSATTAGALDNIDH